jgi:gas vesicle protein
MTQPNGQPQTPPEYTLPRDLVAQIYQLLGQMPAQNAATTYTRLTQIVNEQAEEWKREQDQERRQLEEKLSKKQDRLKDLQRKEADETTKLEGVVGKDIAEKLLDE